MKEQNVVDIEKKALEMLLDERKKQKMSEATFGSLAFPESQNPRGKVNAMYAVKTDSGKNLRLRLGDFCAMCAALGLNPPEQLFSIWSQSEKD